MVESKHLDSQREVAINNVSRGLVTVTSPGSIVSDAYRTLRTNLMYTLRDVMPRTIIMTSPDSIEGKSTACANLAVVLTQADKSTLIMDCDLRKPTVHELFGLRNEQGLADALAENRSLREIWQEPLLGLKVVPAGSVPPNPTELLGSRVFAELLDQARQEFDYVLIDAPPTWPVSDALILATLGDGVLLVLDSRNTGKAAVRQAMNSLQGVGANVLGTVMNNIELSKDDYRHHGYPRE